MPDSGVILFHLYHQDQDQDNSSHVFTTTLHRSLVLFANFPSNSPPRRPPPVPQFPASMVDPCGSSLVVKASDGKMVMVTLPNPLQVLPCTFTTVITITTTRKCTRENLEGVTEGGAGCGSGAEGDVPELRHVPPNAGRQVC
ncbi:uncharacterized protein LOC135094096 isoform X1 [Scylla paramamosain]|uniref:uncharacterized protein LOC135094096 isoform X1 n=2 Tax=Scylla paramamosain TaxID=85552 RepID=UPI0030827A4B